MSRATSKPRDRWIPLAESQPPAGLFVLLLRLDGKVLVGCRRWWEDNDDDGDGEDGSSWMWEAQEDDDGTEMNLLDNPLTHWRRLSAKPSRAARLGAVERLARKVRREIDEALDAAAKGDEGLPTAKSLLYEYESLCETLLAAQEPRP